jgi:orotate phosphoribosyltransferase-like protein
VTHVDYFVDWSNVGSSTRRLSLFGWALADLAKETLERKEFEDFDVVVGLDLSGDPIALIAADELGKPYAIVRSPRIDETGKRTVPRLATPYSTSLKVKKNTSSRRCHKHRCSIEGSDKIL